MGTIQHRDLQGHWSELYRICFVQRGKNRCNTSNLPILNIFIRFRDIRHRTSKSTIYNFAGFWPLKIFCRSYFKILNRHYKTQPSADQRAKFQASRPTYLRDLAREI